MRGYEAIAATSRASRCRAPVQRRHPRAARRAGADLSAPSSQQQFAPELDALDAGARRPCSPPPDALTQIETIELYRVHHGYSPAETHARSPTALRLPARPDDARW